MTSKLFSFSLLRSFYFLLGLSTALRVITLGGVIIFALLALVPCMIVVGILLLLSLLDIKRYDASFNIGIRAKYMNRISDEILELAMKDKKEAFILLSDYCTALPKDDATILRDTLTVIINEHIHSKHKI
jgi:hypothetical protein